MKNTEHLQTISLIEFAKALNLVPTQDAEGNKWFESEEKGMQRISVQTVINLHNGYWYPAAERKGYGYCKGYENFVGSNYLITRALAAKIVNKVKAQYSKKKKRMVFQSQIISFVDPDYYDIFM
jgi:hypothetical protein